MGILAKVTDKNFGVVGYTYTIIAMRKYQIMLMCLTFKGNDIFILCMVFEGFVCVNKSYYLQSFYLI
jgi:hypothetical protein